MRPGTKGFDHLIRLAYREAHPAVAAWNNQTRGPGISRIWYAHSAPGEVIDPVRGKEVLMRDFPAKSATSSAQADPHQPLPSLLELQKKTVEDFLLMGDGTKRKGKGRKGK